MKVQKYCYKSIEILYKNIEILIMGAKEVWHYGLGVGTRDKNYTNNISKNTYIIL